MSDVSRLLSLKYGINASATTFGTEPGSYGLLVPRDIPTTMFPRSRQVIDRNLATVDGRRLSRMFGTKEIGEVSVPMFLMGVDGNSGAAFSTAQFHNAIETGLLLTSIMGTSPVATTGSTVSATSSSGTSLTVVGTSLNNNDVMMIKTTYQGVTAYEAREVVSGGGTTSIVMNRALLGTVSSGDLIIRGARWEFSTATTSHLPIWFDVEGEDWRRKYHDCVPSSLVITIPNTGPVQADFSFMPNDWSDVAEANPSFTGFTGAGMVVAGGSYFIVETSPLMLRNAKLTINLGTQMRESTTGINGVCGGVCVDKTNIMLEGELYVGASSGGIGWVADDAGLPTVDSILGDGTNIGAGSTLRDVMLQVGNSPQCGFYMRMPAADFQSGGMTNQNGFVIMPFKAMATGVAPIRLAMF